MQSGDSDEAKQPPSPPRYEKGGFGFPIACEEERSEANKRISQAFRHMPNSDLFNSQGKWESTASLYLGNVEYNASEQDIYKYPKKIEIIPND